MGRKGTRRDEEELVNTPDRIGDEEEYAEIGDDDDVMDSDDFDDDEDEDEDEDEDIEETW